MQDNEEKFPDAKTWNSALATTYGVVGKVWDCPTVTHTGAPDQPDYFFVAGSFLSALALGDVKKPDSAPLIADLNKPQTNKPYVNDGDTNNGDIAAGLVDCRHNGGAVFAFVDGHTEWIRSEKVTGILFIDSIDVMNLKRPAYLGMISKTPFDFQKADFRSTCVSYGADIAVGMGSTATAVAIGRAAADASYPLTAAKEFGTPVTVSNAAYAAPSWWKLGVGGCTVVSTGGTPLTANTWSRVSGGNYVGELCGGAANTTSTCAFTIVPTLSSDTTKRMILVANATSAAAATATLVSIQHGTEPAIPIGQSVTSTGTSVATGGWSNGGMFLIPVRANTNLTINISVAGSATHVGALLVFEN
ncbi:MAG: H-X9-DG-CTERM domain-containing protein [Armatimonadota bacterium]